MAVHGCIQQRYALAELSIATAGQVNSAIVSICLTDEFYRAIDNAINYWPEHVEP